MAAQRYRIRASDGRDYEIRAEDPSEAVRMETFINEQLAAGNTDPNNWNPDNAIVQKLSAAQTLKRTQDTLNGKAGYQDLVMQGVSLGLSDEASGVANAVMNPLTPGSYEAGRDAARLRLDDARASTGGLGTVAEIGGGFIGGAPRAGLGALRSVGESVRNSAVAGGVGGAIAGFGTGEGLGNSVVGSAIGALAGAGLGAILPVGVSMAANRLGGAQRLFSSDRGAIARQIVGETVEADAGTVGNLGARIGEAQQRGVPLTIADTGENARGLLASVARRPGGARTLTREAVTARQLEQSDRVVGAINRDLGPTGNVPQISDNLMRGASARAAPLYDEAYATQVDMTPDLIAILETPAGRQALNKARTIAANERRDPTALGFDLDEAGDTILTATPSMQTLDLVKRGLDDVLEDARDPVTRRLPRTSTTGAIDQVRKDLLGQLDTISPAYAEARAAFAGPAGQRDALELGRKSLNASAEDIERATAPLSPEEAQQFALGFRSAMTDNLGRATDGANLSQRLLGTPRKRAALTRLFGGEENFDNFIATMADERATSQTYQSVMGGSQTAERAAFDATTDDGGLIESAVGSAIRNTRGGNPVTGMLADFLQTLRDADRFGAGQAGNETRESIAALLTEQDPAVLRGLAETIREAAQRQAASVGRRNSRAAVFGGVQARIAGSGVAETFAPAVSPRQ